MLINFFVENFQSIKNKVHLTFEASSSDDLEEYYMIQATESLRLLKLGLIYGANASGKTSLLQSLDFLRQTVSEPLDNKKEALNFEPFLFDKESKEGNTTFEIEFLADGIKYAYELELNKRHIVREKLQNFDPNKAKVFERTTDADKQLTKISFGSKVKIKTAFKDALEANTLWNNTVFGGYTKTNFESKALQACLDWFVYQLRPLISADTPLTSFVMDYAVNDKINKNDLIHFLQAADFNISNFQIKEEEIVVDEQMLDALLKTTYLSNEAINEIAEEGKLKGRDLVFVHKINGEEHALRYLEESEGTKRYFQFSGLLSFMINYSSIVPIDEIESSLHPDLLRHFILSFLVNAKESQLIATTHLRELLMEKDILRADAIWFTEKLQNGCTELYSLDDFDSSVVRKDTGSIFNAYKVGKLGAVPNLGDTHIPMQNGEEK